MSSEPSFTDLMARLRAGDEHAATQIYNQFAHRLLALAASRLDRRLRRKVDPEDVVQSVLKSFFIRYREGQFDFRSRESLWALLTEITLRKCGHWAKHFRTQGRDIEREVSPPAQPRNSEESSRSWEVLGRGPTPAQAAMLTEITEELVRGLSEQERQILTLHLQGCSTAEIAKQVSRTRRLVQLVLERVRKRLERMRDQDVKRS